MLKSGTAMDYAALSMGLLKSLYSSRDGTPFHSQAEGWRSHIQMHGASGCL
jgi:hypothetical protein